MDARNLQRAHFLRTGAVHCAWWCRRSHIVINAPHITNHHTFSRGIKLVDEVRWPVKDLSEHQGSGKPSRFWAAFENHGQIQASGAMMHTIALQTCPNWQLYDVHQ